MPSTLHRLRRQAPALAAAGLLVSTLAGCGSSSGSGSTSSDSVSITGPVGKKIQATWHGKLATPKAPAIRTLVKGKGPKIADGDTVMTYLWIADGSTKKVAFSDYAHGQPEPIPKTSRLNTVFTKLFANATYGSRVQAITAASSLFGPSGNPQLGVHAKDSIVVVADLIKKQPTSPNPKDTKVHTSSAKAMPKVVSKKGVPVSLDFKSVAKPSLDTPVQRLVLKQGKGAVVKPSDTVKVNYLGETYDAQQPFDESYSRTPLTAPLSGLVPGWRIGLSGVKVGSRVLLQIPPALGYGSQGSGQIPGNATLWFVVDVLKASK